MAEAIVRDAAFPRGLFDEASTLLMGKAIPWHYGWHSRHGQHFAHWNVQILDPGRKNTTDVGPQMATLAGTLWEPVLALWRYLQRRDLAGAALLRCYANQHTFGVEGYPHTDSHRHEDWTIVCYMNPEWRPEWAGETVLLHHGDTVHATQPRPNRLLMFPGDQQHAARALSRVCPVGRITLMFKAQRP